MKQLSVISVVTVAVLGMATAVMASDRDQDRARELTEAGTILPLEQIVGNARERHAGNLLEAELEKDESGYYYEVEIVDAEGVVRELKYDASTAELLSDKQDD